MLIWVFESSPNLKNKKTNIFWWIIYKSNECENVFFPKPEIKEIINYILPLQIFILHNSYPLAITKARRTSTNFWKCMKDMGHTPLNDHDYHNFLTLFSCFWGYWIKIKHAIIHLAERACFS